MFFWASLNETKKVENNLSPYQHKKFQVFHTVLHEQSELTCNRDLNRGGFWFCQRTVLPVNQSKFAYTEQTSFRPDLNCLEFKPLPVWWFGALNDWFLSQSQFSTLGKKVETKEGKQKPEHPATSSQGITTFVSSQH